MSTQPVVVSTQPAAPTSRTTTAMTDAGVIVLLLGSVAARAHPLASLAAVALLLLVAMVVAATLRGARGSAHHLLDLSAVAAAAALSSGAAPDPGALPDIHGHGGAAAVAPVLGVVLVCWAIARGVLLRRRSAADRRSPLLTGVVAAMCLAVIALGSA